MHYPLFVLRICITHRHYRSTLKIFINKIELVTKFAELIINQMIFHLWMIFHL